MLLPTPCECSGAPSPWRSANAAARRAGRCRATTPSTRGRSRTGSLLTTLRGARSFRGVERLAAVSDGQGRRRADSGVDRCYWIRGDGSVLGTGPHTRTRGGSPCRSPRVLVVYARSSTPRSGQTVARDVDLALEWQTAPWSAVPAGRTSWKALVCGTLGGEVGAVDVETGAVLWQLRSPAGCHRRGLDSCSRRRSLSSPR